jgi:Putative NADPH-quinone reductase (modulator of drug activity B)
MKTDSKTIALINGSPRTVENTASQNLILLQEKILKMEGHEVFQVNVRKSITSGNRVQAFEAIRKADVMIITFPLYIFCLPGVLTRFLQDFDEYEKLQSDKMVGKKIYTVVNCGFPEAGINEDAVRVVQSFSRQIGADFRYGIMIGGGGMIGQTLNLSFMKKVHMKLEKEFQAISDDIHSQKKATENNKSIELKIPSQFYYFMGGKGWISSAKGNGLKKKDLYRKPYQQTIQ